jgi:hypothetical protein
MLERRPNVAGVELTLSRERAFFILERARELEAKTPQTDPASASNPTDDKGVDILEDRPGDATRAELLAAVRGLNVDEQLDLIALTLLGRGDYEVSEWSEARRAAADVGVSRAPGLMAGSPLASDYLAEGLSQLGYDPAEFTDRR